MIKDGWYRRQMNFVCRKGDNLNMVHLSSCDFYSNCTPSCVNTTQVRERSNSKTGTASCEKNWAEVHKCQHSQDKYSERYLCKQSSDSFQKPAELKPYTIKFLHQLISYKTKAHRSNSELKPGSSRQYTCLDE